jgi:hypothetical protein
MDALSVGIVMGVQPFLSVFLARLGATNFQVGLLSSIPGFVGLFLSIAIGRFLQSRENIVPWYAGLRLIRILKYGIAGAISLFLPDVYAIPAILGWWVVSSVPDAMLSVCFNVMMNAVSGPKGRYVFLSRRWSIIGLVGALMALIAGQLLTAVTFPLNYEIAFITFASISGLLSYHFVRRYRLPEQTQISDTKTDSETSSHLSLSSSISLVWENRPFVGFLAKRLVYIFGSWLVMPLFSLYYVRDVGASDAWISWFAIAEKLALLVGYIFWAKQRTLRSGRFILLSTTLGMSLYPIFVASSQRVDILVLLSAFAGLFSAGSKLVLFDELMNTVPPEHSATFIGISMTLQNMLSVVGPLFNTKLADYIGLSWALVVGASVRLLGFMLFAINPKEDDTESSKL